MKTKLLRKLRKQIVIQERNGKFRVFDNKICLGNINNKTTWGDNVSSKQIRRDWILKEAQKYFKPKN